MLPGASAVASSSSALLKLDLHYPRRAEWHRLTARIDGSLTSLAPMVLLSHRYLRLTVGGARRTPAHRHGQP